MSGKVHAVNVIEGPVPSLKISMELENSHHKSIIVMVMDITIAFSPSNVEFKVMEIPNHLAISERSSHPHEFNVQIPKYIFDIIEKHREHDVNMGIGINSLAKDDDGELRRAWMGGDYKFSQKEWTDLLEKIGYHKQWIIEIPRPEILPFEDVDRVEKELKAAHDSFSQGENSDAVFHCRKCIEILIKIIDNHKEKINKEINDKSIKEDKKPLKSERYRQLLDYLQVINHTGAHPAYWAFKEDAETLLLMTTALVGYYSKMLSKVV